MKISTLTIEMAANVARLTRDMDKAQRTVDKAMGGITSAVKTAQSAFALLGAGLSVAGFSRFVGGAAQAADEVVRFSRLANSATEDFQRLAFGAQRYGIQQEKLADILKDTQDKVGDFMQTGGGAMADFFEQIAPRVGVTADQFRNLGGSDALQLYVSSLEKANLSQSEMTFYMEAIANDSTLLLPLLRDNGKEMQRLGEAAASAGVLMDDGAIAAAQQFRFDLNQLQSTVSGMGTQLAMGLMPTLQSITGEFLKSADGGSRLQGVSSALATALKALYSVGLGVASVFKAVGTSLGGGGAVIGAVLRGEFSAAVEIARMARADISAQLVEAGASIQRVWAEPAAKSVSVVAQSMQSASAAIGRAAASSKKAGGASKEHAAALREQEKAAKDLADTMVRAMQLTAQSAEEYIRAADALVSSNQSLRDEIELIGLSDEARHALLMTKEAEALADRELLLLGLQNADSDVVTIANLEREIALRKQRIGLLNEKQIAEVNDTSVKEAQKVVDEQNKAYADMWASIDATAHDVFVSVANEGEDAFKRIGKTLKAAILDMLYQMTIKRWIFQISGQVSGGFGGGGANGVTWSDLTSLYSAFTTGGASAGGSAAALGAWAGGSMSTANAVGSMYANATGTGINGLLATNGAYGTAGGASGAAGSAGAGAMGYLGWAALIAAAVMIAENLYEKGYTRAALGKGDPSENRFGNTSFKTDPRMGESALYNYSFENQTRKMLDALGMNEKWADILSGTTRMATLFGRKLGAYGMTASIEGGETSVSGFARYKGGAFRSNKTVGIDIDPRDAEMLQAQVRSTTEAAKAYARAMGLSEEAINGFTGSVQVNFKNAKTAEEQAQRMAEAMEKLQIDMLRAAGATDMTRESFRQMQEAALAAANAAGINGQNISDVLLNGMVNGLSSEQVGAQLSDVIVGGIYRSIAQQYTQQIAAMFMNQIVTPIFTAMAAGVPISQAISQASIQSMVQSAQQAAEALNAIFSDAGFQEAMAAIGEAIGGVVGSFGGIEIPNFSQELEQRLGLEQRLLELLGKTDQLRAMELEKLDDSNKALQLRIWALEDSKTAVDAAYQALERSINAQLDIARKTEENLGSIFETLRSNILELRGEVEATTKFQADQARALIQQAIASGKIPDGDRLSEAIAAARQGLEDRVYATQFERDRERLLLAAELKKLALVVQPQLSEAEQQVILLEEQLETAKKQIDAINKVDNSIKSVAEALAGFAKATEEYNRLMSQAAGVSVGGGGGGGGYSGGGESAGPRWNADGYGAKNPDLIKHFEENRSAVGWPADLSTLEKYLAWHWAQYGKKEGRAFATGGAFTNGIVRRPTHFNMGLMGEAGDEAIMPLTNVGGSLGVRATTSTDPEVKTLLRELIQRVSNVEAASVTTAVNTGATDKRWKSVIRTEDGDPVLMVGRPDQKPLQTTT